MQLKKIIRLFVCLVLMIPAAGHGQTKRIDSLKKQLQAMPAEKDKLTILLALCKEQSSLNPDSVYRYAITAKEIAGTQQDQPKLSLADFYLCNLLLIRGFTDSSRVMAGERLKKLRYIPAEKEIYVNYCLLQARALNNLNRAKEALDLLYPLLAQAEKQEDTGVQIRTMNGMVSSFVTTGNDKEAQQWCFKAFRLFPRPTPFSLQETLSITLNNLGITFIHLNEVSGERRLLDSAENYTNQSIVVSTQNELLGSLAYSYGLKATLMGNNHKAAEGEQMLKESLAIYRQIGNVFYIINAMAVLGNFYGITNQPQKGIAICKEGIELSKTSRPNIYLYLNLASNYKLAGEYRLYGETLEQLSDIKDSLHNKNSAEAISEIQTRYEIQKKENTIIEQNYALAKKNYLAYGSLLLLLIVSMFFIILIRLNRKRQEFKFQTIQKKEKRLNEIAVSTAEENERRRIAAELHDNLGGQLSYISSNMDFILDAPAMLTEAEKIKHLNKVNQTAKSTIADLRESIWALKKQQVEIDELADKLKLYAQHQLGHQTHLHLEVKENISTNSVLSSAEALHVFRIFQEAVNNALKYAAASTIVLSIETGSDLCYRISLEDNGKGFVVQPAYSDHYGLENMRERARDIQATLEITSAPLQGTRIKVEKKNPAITQMSYCVGT